jgi:hypothetical protein
MPSPLMWFKLIQVVAIWSTLGEHSAHAFFPGWLRASPPPLHIPASYTASFTTEWLNGLGDGRPNGWQTAGTVHVSAGEASFTVATFKPGETKVSLTYTGGLLFAGSVCVDIAQAGVQLPDLASVTTAGIVEHAVSWASTDDVGLQALPPCSDGRLYAIGAFGADVVFCASADARALHWVHSPMFHTSITSWEEGGVHVDAPRDADMRACIPTRRRQRLLGSEAAAVTAGPEAAGWWVPMHRAPPLPAHPQPHPLQGETPSPLQGETPSARLKAARARRLLPKGAPKHVCMLHGMGGAAVSTPGFPGPTRMDASQDAPQAAHNSMGEGPMLGFAGAINLDPEYTHFLLMDTITRGWNNKQTVGGKLVPSTELQDAYYEFIRYYKCDVVFAHSMGNLVLAALAGRGKPVRWYAVAGPFRGTVTLNYIEPACVAISALALPSRLVETCSNPWLCRDTSVSFCTQSLTASAACIPTPSEFSMVPEPSWCRGLACYRVKNQTFGASTEADAAVYEQHILGRMCGRSAFGSGGTVGAALVAIAAIAAYSSPNDGLVEFSSCAASANFDSTTGFSYNNPWSPLYAPVLNHRDVWSSSSETSVPDKMPLSWYKHMIERGSGGVCPIAGSGCAQPGTEIF